MQINYDEIRQALKTLKTMCNEFGKCMGCPCSNGGGRCLIAGHLPSAWALQGEDRPVRLMVEID